MNIIENLKRVQLKSCSFELQEPKVSRQITQHS